MRPSSLYQNGSISTPIQHPGDRTPSVLYHMCATGHVLDLDSFTILEHEADWMRRGTREVIYVKRVAPGLNKSGGLHCVLSLLWDRPFGVKAVRANRPEDVNLKVSNFVNIYSLDDGR